VEAPHCDSRKAVGVMTGCRRPRGLASAPHPLLAVGESEELAGVAVRELYVACGLCDRGELALTA